MSGLQSSISAAELQILREPQEGRWTDRQNAAYILFLQLNKTTFCRKQKRREHKFYKKMSSLIKTRTPVQCRSHHQKLQSKYKYFNKIISKYKENQDLSLYYQQKRKFEPLPVQNHLQSPKKVSKEQKPVQKGSFAIQTDYNGLDLQFIRAQDYLKLQQEGMKIQNGNSNCNYVFTYQYPSWIPPNHIKIECKIQEAQEYGHYRMQSNYQERPYF